MPDNDPEIHLNGQPRAIAPGTTIADLVAELVPDPRLVAVERNGSIVPRSNHAGTHLTPGDHIEIVSFVQGGT